MYNFFCGCTALFLYKGTALVHAASPHKYLCLGGAAAEKTERRNVLTKGKFHRKIVNNAGVDCYI
jgi:hypothetical protein